MNFDHRSECISQGIFKFPQEFISTDSLNRKGDKHMGCESAPPPQMVIRKRVSERRKALSRE